MDWFSHQHYRFLLYLMLTLAVEIPVLLILRYFFGELDKELNRDSAAKTVPAGFFASLMTLPYVWFVIPRFLNDRQTALVVSEIFAFSMEAVFYRLLLKTSWFRAGFYSLVCNGASFGAGLLLNQLMFRLILNQ